MTRLPLPRIARTCRHCGASTDDALRDMRVGMRCCRQAVVDQITWRERELDDLRRTARRDAAEAEARAATLDADRAERVRRGYQQRLQTRYQPQADDLKAEIARLQQMLDGDQTELPRPYRDA